MRHLIICIFLLVLVIACNQHGDKTVKNVGVKLKANSARLIKSDSVIKRKVYPLTDSGQLMLHLDSLPSPSFPYQSDGGIYQPQIVINLSAFKNKKLFNIPIKLIPIKLGGGVLDHGEELDEKGILPDSIRETFNLVDTLTFKIGGVLIATTPKFVVIDCNGTLVTLSYNVNVIDAINSAEGQGNNHWKIWRETTINKNLTMVVHGFWSGETERKGHFEDENEDEHWYIDEDGHIKKQHIRHLIKKHR